MISKKEGIINGIIYENTISQNGNRIYLTVDMLIYLIKEIIKSKATTQYLRFNLFYINQKKQLQLEFDTFMFYLECRDGFTSYDQYKHIAECYGKEYLNLSKSENKIGEVLFPLCVNGHSERYKDLLTAYEDYLYELLPELMKEAILRMDLKHEDLSFGHFCFEVHSG